MIQFKAIIEQFHEKGEKSGWTYIEVPVDIAEQLNPGTKKAFRVKGKLDSFAFEWVSLIPMGGGNFIMALNAATRKAIKKSKGATVNVEMELDTKEKPLCADFITCLEDEPAATAFFYTLAKGHQRYFSNWIETAKTENTRTRRIAQAVNALARGLDFSQMIRMNKNDSYC